MKTINDYAELVKEKHALNKTIAPVETNETDASRAYAVGEQLIFNGTLYDVIAPISQHDVITTTGSGANIAPAGPISSKIQTLTNKLEDEIETRAKLGAHNFLIQDRIPTSSNVTITVNEDKSITISGTTVSESYFQLSDQLGLSGDFIGSGCPSGGSNDTFFFLIVRRNADSTADEQIWKDFGDGVQISLESAKKTRAFIVIRANVTINATFYPMIRLASDSNKTYQPYAMTNRELTEKVDGVDYEMQYNGAYFHVIKYGDYYHCYSNSNFTSTPSIDDWTTIGSVPNSTNRDFCGILLMNSGVILKVRVKADGNVQIYKVSGTFGSNLYIQCSCVLA